jgi:hypothetical protein
VQGKPFPGTRFGHSSSSIHGFPTPVKRRRNHPNSLAESHTTSIHRGYITENTMTEVPNYLGNNGMGTHVFLRLAGKVRLFRGKETRLLVVTVITACYAVRQQEYPRGATNGGRPFSGDAAKHH